LIADHHRVAQSNSMARSLTEPVRSATDKKSIKLRRKAAAWKTDYLGNLLAGQNL
jgi:hypothetical protein